MKIAILFLVVMLSINSFASNAGDWLEIAPDARAIAMGGAQAAGVNSAYASFWNPASRSRMTEIGSTFASLFGQANYQYFGAMNSFAFGKVGIGYMRVGLEGLQRASLSAELRPIASGDEFSILNSALLLSYSENLGRFTGLTDSPLRAIDLGITGKIINQVIDQETVSGFGLDVGMQCLINQHFQFAAVAYNALAPAITWSTGTLEVFTAKLKLGMRYLPVENLMFTADTDVLGYQKFGVHLGSEYWVNSLLAFRAGYDKESLSMGLGIDYEGFKFDYAYTAPSAGYMDASSRVSMGFTFSGSGQQNLLASAF